MMIARAVAFARNRQSLRQRLTGGLALVAVVSVLTIGTAVIGFVHQVESRSWDERQQEASAGAVQIVESYLSWAYSELVMIGNLDPTYLQANPNAMPNAANDNLALNEIVRVDNAGRIVAAAQGSDWATLGNLFTIQQSNWFLQAREGQAYTGDLQLSADNKPFVVMAAPTGDGGVVAARLKMDMLGEVVANLRFGETGRAYIVDRYGYILAHPDPRVVEQQSSLAQRPEFLAVVETTGSQDMGRYRNFQGRDVDGRATHIDYAHWLIFTEVDIAEATRSRRLGLVLLGGGIVVIAGLMVLVNNHLLRRSVLEPLETLRQGAMHIGQGNLEARLSSAGPEDISQVATAFNWMAAQLQEREALLAQARDEAIAASQFKSRLLANVSHDLRTPLGSIVGYAEMLSEGYLGTLTQEQKMACELVAVNGRRLSHLIADLLDEAQIEAGRFKLHCAPFQPADLIPELHATLGLIAQRKGLKLVTTVDPDLPHSVIGDQQRVQQILLNLVDNAIKATSKGQVSVRLYPNSHHWIIEVSDTGRGIPAAAHRYIFDPFRQVEETPGEYRVGVGLGLSIVRQLVGLMGGEIRLQSQEGVGTTFAVSLPLEPKTGVTA